MSEQDQNIPKKELSAEEKAKAAQSLNQVVVDSYTPDDTPMIKQGDLAPGDYAAVVKSSWLFASRDDGTLWIGFRLHVKGKVASFGNMAECDWVDRGTLLKVLKLEGNEYNVRMLLSLYRALGIRRDDGEPVLQGGDLCYSKIPRDTWVTLWVKRGKDGTNYIARLNSPKVTAEDEEAAFAPQPAAGQTYGGEAEGSGGLAPQTYEETGAQPYGDDLPDEPPF